MSPFPEGTQPDDNKNKDAIKRRRNILLASLIGLAVLSLLVLLASPGLLIPPSNATDDGVQEAEATDGEDMGGNDTAVEILPASNSTNPGMDDGEQDELVVQNTGNGFTGGYVSYPGEVKDTRRGGGSGGSDPVEDSDDQGTGGGNGGDDDDQNGGPGSGGETGGTEGCDPQYWQNHPENWPEPLTPTTLFSDIVAFNFTIPGMEDLTLMDALGLEGNLANELIREGAAGLLNAEYDEIDYPKSPPTVVRNVEDGLSPQIIQSDKYADDDDMQNRKDMLQAANDLVCPLLPN